ncbi:MAG: M23 family metallopeptidase [Pseudomonadota bacterium]
MTAGAQPSPRGGLRELTEITVASAVPAAIIAAGLVFAPYLLDHGSAKLDVSLSDAQSALETAQIEVDESGDNFDLSDMRLGVEASPSTTQQDFDVALAIARSEERRSAVVDNLRRIDGLLDRARNHGIETAGILDGITRIGTWSDIDKPQPIDDARNTTQLAFANAGTGFEAAPFDRFDVPESVSLYRLRTAIETVDDRIDRMEWRQARVLTALENRLESQARALVAIPKALGLAEPPAPSELLGSTSAIGGPWLPIADSPPSDAIDLKIDRLEQLLAYSEHLRGVVDSLPIRNPMLGEHSVSSRFGPRRDPFTGRMARHGGIDFRAKTGTPVVATAQGVVRIARRYGGYGKLVEIDHGNGLRTRYAHLSDIDVEEGDSVAPGEIIGDVGSTGRSTGPHLHYEVRVSGVARNPTLYLDAGRGLNDI